jgi:hypothetical protein
VTEYEVLQELLIAIDARLRAFTDREVKYYLSEDFAAITVSILMLIPKMGGARLLQMPISCADLMRPSWQSAHVAHIFIDNWIEKLKMERKYEDLNVIFDSPPSWAVNSLEEKK